MMKSDLHRTFGEIFNDDISAFRNQLVEIQRYRTDRDESIEWARRLRFLDISGVPDLDALIEERKSSRPYHRELGYYMELPPSRRPKLSIPIVEEDDDDDEPPIYLAVSWKWLNRADSVSDCWGVRQSFRYYIQRPGSSAHVSSFPDRYMDRVIRVAQSHGITKIWIDIECIYQKDGDEAAYPRDRELGVQVMDLVYEDAKLGIGLTTTELLDQEEVDMLAGLLSGDIFVGGNTKSRDLKPDVDVVKVQLLILRILSDPRWSRAWIFQEDHLSDYRMILLIPHAEELDKCKTYDFGNVLGELQVKVHRFRECVTAFCLAQRDLRRGWSTSIGRWPSSEMLQKAKRYRTFNSTDLEEYPTTTYSVLSDICGRSIEKEQDRIAILANALRFPARLDISETSPLVKLEKYSLSATLFALILINGEIIKVRDNDTILRHTLQSYTEWNEYRIKASHLRKPQSFVDRCRFRSPTITKHGLETQGWIFRLFFTTGDESTRAQDKQASCIELSQTERAAFKRLRDDEASQARASRSILNTLEQEVMVTVIFRLDSRWPGCRLANLLCRSLSVDREPPPQGQENPATTKILKMMCAVVQALIENSEVRLACLHSQPEHSPPSAMFVSPQYGFTPSRGHVFTSWDNPTNAHRQERLASLEVAAHDPERNYDIRWSEGDVLKNCSWVNGVWDARGEPLETYVFPYMDCNEGDGPRGTKRKRNEGLDSPTSDY
jgi:hypothetical protein